MLLAAPWSPPEQQQADVADPTHPMACHLRPADQQLLQALSALQGEGRGVEPRICLERLAIAMINLDMINFVIVVLKYIFVIAVIPLSVSHSVL